MHKVTVMKVSGPKKPGSLPNLQMDPIMNMMQQLGENHLDEEPDPDDDYEAEEGEDESTDPSICIELNNIEDNIKDKLVTFLEKLKVKTKINIKNKIELGESKSDLTKDEE